MTPSREQSQRVRASELRTLVRLLGSISDHLLDVNLSVREATENARTSHLMAVAAILIAGQAEARDTAGFLELLKMLERVAVVRQEEQAEEPEAPSRRWSPSTAQLRALKQMREDLEREAGGDFSA